MMQLLEAGGLPLMTDRERAADVDNPRGYYEWEAIKQIGKKPELLDDETVEGTRNQMHLHAAAARCRRNMNTRSFS